MLYIWWSFTIVHSRSLIHIMVSCFVGINMLKYTMYSLSRPGTLQKLEEDICKAFPDQETRLEWLQTKVSELECSSSRKLVKP